MNKLVSDGSVKKINYAGVNTYRWQGGEQRPATIISEPDRNVRYARLA
ncbi:hypothetical protein NDY44_005151, partial [Escherichia coli]|nr:hypothetical protein [Escherichia coli]